MNHSHGTFQTLVRQAAQAATGVNRRGTLRMLGGATLSGLLATPAGTDARDTGKHTGDADTKARKRCREQRGECLAYFKQQCATAEVPAACEAKYAPCCEPFKRCNAGAAITCVFSKAA